MVPKVNCILLVDDDRVTNLLHKRQISRCGLAHNVDAVTDGCDALKYLDELVQSDDPLPEMILLDINMPRMNGFEFLFDYAKLPESRTKLSRIIMVSTSTLPSDIARAEADPNVHEYARKPLADTDLKRLVHDYCDTNGTDI